MRNVYSDGEVGCLQVLGMWVLHRAAQESDGVLALQVVQIQGLSVYWSLALKRGRRKAVKRIYEMAGEFSPP